MAIRFVTTDALKWGTGEGSPHTAAQADNNFWELLQRIVELETNPIEGLGIESFSLVGNQLTITMTDATTRGPFTVPVVVPAPKGEWQPLFTYQAYNFISESGRLYMTDHAFTSEATFDPNEEDITGFQYILVLQQPVQPNDLNVFIGGIMSDAQLILFMESTRRWQLPEDLTGSFFRAQVAATADTVVTFKKNGASIGTINWAIAGTVPSVVFTAAVTFEIGDTFAIHGPATADLTLADVSFNMRGTRI